MCLVIWGKGEGPPEVTWMLTRCSRNHNKDGEGTTARVRTRDLRGQQAVDGGASHRLEDLSKIKQPRPGE